MSLNLNLEESLGMIFEEEALDNQLNPLIKHDSKGEVGFVDSECYIVVEGIEKRKICGFLNADGDYCRQGAGANTPHLGTGYCLHHSTPHEEENFINKLQVILGRGTTMGDLLQRVNTITEVDMKNVDIEIKILYALVMNIFEELKIGGKITVELERRLKSLAKEIRDTKMVRGRLNSLTTVNASYVVYIMEKMAVILKRLVPEQADQIMSSFLNLQRSPYNDALQSGLGAEGPIEGGGKWPLK